MTLTLPCCERVRGWTIATRACPPGLLSAASRRRVEELFSTEDPDDRLIADVVNIVAEAGGLDRAKARGEQFAQEAEEALEPLPDSPVRSALTDAISYVMDRRS